MSKKTITKYYCDVCGSEHNLESDLKIVNLPFKELDCEGRLSYNYKNFDLCKNCCDKHTNIVFNHFAEIIDVMGNLKVYKGDELN